MHKIFSKLNFQGKGKNYICMIVSKQKMSNFGTVYYLNKIIVIVNIF